MMKWSLCITGKCKKKKKVSNLKDITSGRVDLNECIFSFNWCNLHYDSDSKFGPIYHYIYIFWWIKAKNITILIMHCASFQMLKHFRFYFSFFISHFQWDCHFPINTRVHFRASICFRYTTHQRALSADQ